MVYRNNNLKKARQNKSEISVYPFNVDVPSFPERKYLLGIYRFARVAYVSLFIAMVFCLFIVFRAFSRDVNPRFIQWNDIENSFEYVNFSYSEKPKIVSKEVSFIQYLNQYFIRNFIIKRFSVSPVMVENYNNWCDCSNKKSSKMGIFDLEQECYLCLFSTQSVYKSFVDNSENTYNQMYENGITRDVKVLNITLVKSAQTNPELSVIEWFLNKTKPITLYQTYKVSFLVDEIKNKKIINRDVLIGYISIQGNLTSPQNRSVINEIYMFNPNYNLVLKQYEEENQNANK